jgi:hypothetical protein
MNEQSWHLSLLRSPWAIVQITCVLLVLIVVSAPYIETEINQSLYQSQVQEFKSFCPNSVQDVKLVKFEKYRNTAKIYCLYHDSKENKQLELNYSTTQGWRVIYTKGLQPEDGFYWPIYF